MSVASAQPALEARWTRVVRSRDAWAGAVTVVLSLGLAVWALKLWRANLQVPFRYSVVIDDSKFYLALIKGLIDHGWIYTNHSLGAPFGQQLFDYPQGADDLNLLVMKIIATVSPQIGVVLNVFYLLTFPLNAIVAFVVIRRLGVSPAVSAVCSVLFSLLPYHFFRSDSHPFLSSYASQPLVAYLFIRLLDGSPLFAARGGRPRVVRWLTPRTAWTLVSCLVIASTGLYYAAFGLVVIFSGVLFASLARRPRRVLRGGLLACACITIVLVGNLGPTLVYEAEHGPNAQLQHEADQGDRLALSPSYLVLPPLHDRIGPLRSITTRYANATPPHAYCEQCYESVGTVGDVGLLWLGVVLVDSCVGASFLRRRNPIYRWAALGAAVSVVVATIGGVSSLSRVFITADIRAWNRLSVLIAFFALLSLGLLLDELACWLSARGKSLLFVPVLLAALALGVADQTSSYFVAAYANDAREYRSDAAFTSRVQQVLPANASVFQLPYIPYPEGYQPYKGRRQTSPYNPNLNFEYDEMRPYLHSSKLRWSYGATKGRPADWEAQLAAKPLRFAVTAAVASGFSGLVIEPSGYPHHAEELRRQLVHQLGVSPVVSRDGELWFFDLRPYAARLRGRFTATQLSALRADVLHPIRLTSCSRGRLYVSNPSGRRQRVTVTSTLRSDRRPATLRVRTALGSVTSAFLRRLTVTLQIPAGASAIKLAQLSGRKAWLMAPSVMSAAERPFYPRSRSGPRTGVVGAPCARVGINGP